MPGREQIIAVVRQWIEKAENDLKNAEHTLSLGEGGPTDTVCFHAQQVVEKYLKALLASEGIDFPKTHDIGALTVLMHETMRPELSVEEQRRLTVYATATRYPGLDEPITLADARAAVELARHVRDEMRRHLPREAL